VSGKDAVVIQDLAHPRWPFAFRTINFVGRALVPLISLDEENLIKAARKKTGLTDFGDESFRERMRILLSSVHADANPSPFGRFAARQFMLQLLSNRLLIQDTVNRHPEILKQPIERPIIIAGLPRTGTTHLHHLLSRDPNLRYLPYWESLEPILPENRKPKPGETDPRVKRCEQSIKMLHWVMPLFPRMHEMSVDGPHEEIQLLAIDFSTMLFENMWYIPGYRDWYKAADHTHAYEYLRMVLQVLQWMRGPRRWVLKSPQHLDQYKPLLDAFPDARIIQTHRDPVRITASMCTMDSYGKRMNNFPMDPKINGRYWADRVEDLLRASMRDRHVIPKDQVMDVRFHEFIRDQMGMIRRIYEFIGQPLTAEAEKAMQGYIEENPAGKHGTVVYRLEDFGLDKDERRSVLRAYQEFFNVPDE